jgi:nitric oxide reductase NorE protein
MEAAANPPAAMNRQDLPGDFAIWIFIFAELLVFGIFFLAYAFARANNVELFSKYQQYLDRESGAVNAIKHNAAETCARWLGLAVLSGGVFIGFKLMEFGAKHADGITLSTNTFYMFYLSLTFFHFMHILMGVVILTVVGVTARRGDYSAENHTGVETGASYWHMVDLVWIVLFPLVYVMH